MAVNEAIYGHSYGRKDASRVDGVRTLYTSSDEKPCPSKVKVIVDTCRSLRTDALALEMADQVIVAAVNVYDGTYVAAICEPEVSLACVIRGLQVRLYSVECVDSPVIFLPATTVLSALDRWERQIALVFGRQYAAMLVAGASRTKAPGDVAREDLECIRLQLSSAVGGCLLLQKVDK
jgi:hypothetical protein